MEIVVETRSDEAPSAKHTPSHRNRRWNLKRRRKSSPCYAPPSSKVRRQKVISKPPLYAVLKYMAPLVLMLVTLRYQGKTEGLFEENPVPTWCFLVATCVYGLVGVMERIQTSESKWSQIFKHFALISGSFSIVSLVSIFLSYPLSLVPLIICIALQSAVLVWPILCYAYSSIHTRITNVTDNIRAKIVWSEGCNLKKEAGLPV